MSSESNSYQKLFNAWKEELAVKQLTSLPLNFIKTFLQIIEEFHSNKNPNKFISDIFIKRIEFLIQDLINLRKNKILNSILRREEVPSAYLSKQELLYYDYLKSSDRIIQNKPLNFSNQIKELIIQNSNFKLEKPEKTKTINKTSDTHITVQKGEEQEITSVIFITDLEEFIYLNNQKFGPYKKNDKAKVPKDVFDKVLGPKNIALKKD